MITDFMRKKPRRSRAKSAGPAVGTSPADEAPGASLGETLPANLSGLELRLFAERTGLSEDEVWERIRLGELASRNVRGKIVIFANPGDAASEASDSAPWASNEPARLPDAPGESDRPALPPLPTTQLGAPEPSQPALAAHSSMTDMALLIDHLSLAKEENKEILRLTQDSLRQVTKMSESIIAMKDAMLETSQARVSSLEVELARKEAEIVKLRQAVEDLEMLTSTLSTQ